MTFLAGLQVRLSLRVKIAAIGIIGVLGTMLVGGIYLAGAWSQARSQKIADDATAIASVAKMVLTDMLEARRAEQDFVLRSGDQYVERQRGLATSAIAKLVFLGQNFGSGDQAAMIARFDPVRAGFEIYAKDFDRLVDAKHKLGLDQNSGVEGALRASAHTIESALEQIGDLQLDADLLIMQRHEKDFMLRRDPKYGEAMKEAAAEFKATLERAPFTGTAKTTIRDALAAYQRDFTAWTEDALQIAQVQQEMSDAFGKIEPVLLQNVRDVENLVGQADAANAASRVETMRRMQIAIAAISPGVGTLAFFIARSVSRPLTAMTGTMSKIAGGDLDVVIPGAGRHDEIGQMAGAVEVFKRGAVEKLRLEREAEESAAHAAAERTAGMQTLADAFESAIGNIVETVSSASNELEAAAGTLTKTAENTQNLSATVATASEQASANVQSVASAAEEMSSSIHEISRQVQESSRMAGEAVKQAEKTDARITQLSQAAGRIGDVVKLITAIAEQTNLLALNATIEAARAGESGKGFAVVAQEVKALAAQTARATGDIGAQVSDMQSATNDSVSAIKEIGGTIGRIAEIASTIAVAMEEQGAATQEIARNVHQAAQGTNQVATHITEVNRGANETGTASAQVLSSAQALSSESHHLKLEVERFLGTVRAA